MKVFKDLRDGLRDGVAEKIRGLRTRLPPMTGEEALARAGEELLRPPPPEWGIEVLAEGPGRFSARIARGRTGGLRGLAVFITMFALIFTAATVAVASKEPRVAHGFLAASGVLWLLALAFILLAVRGGTMVRTVTVGDGAVEVVSRSALGAGSRTLRGPGVEVSRFVACSVNGRDVHRLQVSSAAGKVRLGTGIEEAAQVWLMARLTRAINEAWEEHYRSHPGLLREPPAGSGIEVLRRDGAGIGLRLAGRRGAGLTLLSLPWFLVAAGLVVGAARGLAPLFLGALAALFALFGAALFLRGLRQLTLVEELAVGPDGLRCATRSIFGRKDRAASGSGLEVGRRRLLSHASSPLYELQVRGREGVPVRFGSSLSPAGQRWLISRIGETQPPGKPEAPRRAAGC